MRWFRMVWDRLFQQTRQEAHENAASTDRKIHALETHQRRALEALDRELELYRLTAKDRHS